jgi:hypothetical protein
VAVTKPVILPTRDRKRGNPNWGRLPTAFEEQVQRLGLDEENCATSEELQKQMREWRKHNKLPAPYSWSVG